MIPKDPVMLMSFLNTKLRDFYPTLEKLCDELDLDQKEIIDKLNGIGYTYDADKNQFV